MAEYIKRQTVFDSLPIVTEDKTISLYGAVADFMVLVSAIPAADVVEVVRCKDCKHGDAFDGNAVVIWCPYYEDQPVNPDHFCGYGERKDGAADKNVGHTIPVNDLYDEDGSEVTADG